YPVGSIALFRRRPGTGGEPASWQPVTLRAGGESGEPIFVEGREGAREPFTVPQRVQSQLLTATSDGVWIDGERTDLQTSATMFFKGEGEASGRFVASWCGLPARANRARTNSPNNCRLRACAASPGPIPPPRKPSANASSPAFPMAGPSPSTGRS